MPADNFDRGYAGADSAYNPVMSRWVAMFSLAAFALGVAQARHSPPKVSGGLLCADQPCFEA